MAVKTDNRFGARAELALQKFALRQRVLSEEVKLLQRELERLSAALKKGRVKKFIDTLSV